MAKTCIPVLNLGLGLTPLPRLTTDQAIALVAVILRDVATRPRAPGRHQKMPLKGRFISYAHGKGFRGSDRSERIFASVRLLKHAGLTERKACCAIAKILGSHLGSSKRGRPQKSPREPNLIVKAEVVRSIYNSTEERILKTTSAQFARGLVEKWFSYAIEIKEWEAGLGPRLPSAWRPSGFLVQG